MAFGDPEEDVDLKDSDFAGMVQFVQTLVSNLRPMMPSAKKWVKENSDIASDLASSLLGVVVSVGKGVDKESRELDTLSAKWKMRTLKALMKEGFTRAEAMQIILAQVSHSTNWASIINQVSGKSTKSK